MTNYSSSYTVDATETFDFYPAFQYPECTELDGDQPIPDDVQIQYYLYETKGTDDWSLLTRLNSPSIPANEMTNGNDYQLRFTYSPNNDE